MLILNAEIKVIHRPADFRTEEKPRPFFVDLVAEVLFPGGRESRKMHFHPMNGFVWCRASNGNAGQCYIHPDDWIKWIHTLAVTPDEEFDRPDVRVTVTPEIEAEARAYLAHFGEVAKEADCGHKIKFDPIVIQKGGNE